ncbi:uncharacterized protein LOC113771011 [Coffea eugenioides]|uniref:uncharacterized protein LOC113771011 n=1 Tax=Coffea eugenioides TaxID=49369 RepID=UPI000F60E98B|nr:uncharacterized protein LOC113771011 [Coffea eugenioides]
MLMPQSTEQHLHDTVPKYCRNALPGTSDTNVVTTAPFSNLQLPGSKYQSTNVIQLRKCPAPLAPDTHRNHLRHSQVLLIGCGSQCNRGNEVSVFDTASKLKNGLSYFSTYEEADSFTCMNCFKFLPKNIEDTSVPSWNQAPRCLPPASRLDQLHPLFSPRPPTSAHRLPGLHHLPVY